MWVVDEFCFAQGRQRNDIKKINNWHKRKHKNKCIDTKRGLHLLSNSKDGNKTDNKITQAVPLL